MILYLKQLDNVGMPYFSQNVNFSLHTHQITLILNFLLLQYLNSHLEYASFICNLLTSRLVSA